MLNLERKLIPSKPSTRFPNGLLSSRCTPVTTPFASAFPTLTELAYPISVARVPHSLRPDYLRAIANAVVSGVTDEEALLRIFPRAEQAVRSAALSPTT